MSGVATEDAVAHRSTGAEAPVGLDDFARVARTASAKIRSNRHVRRNLPGDGRLELDRSLPFLFVYRRPADRRDDGTADLVTGFSAYLLADGDERFADGIRSVVGAVVEAATGELGCFLLVEVWSAGEAPEPEPAASAMQTIELVLGDDLPDELVDGLTRALESIRITATPAGRLGVPEAVEVRVREGTVAPPGMDELPVALPDGEGSDGDRAWREGDASRVFRIGLEVGPFFRDPATAEPYPLVLLAFRRALVERVEDGLFPFVQERTSLDPPHPRALARRTVGRAARHVDGRLREVSRSFDTLLQVTPTNTEAAWDAFRDGGYDLAPPFEYRPLPVDPEHLKRRLFGVPIERVEDPLLGYLFRETLEDLDRQITMVRELETPRFRQASLQLYGGVEEDLLLLAQDILGRTEPPSVDGGDEEYAEEDDGAPDYVGAEEFADAAREEIGWYRRQSPEFEAGVEIRTDITAGLMVTAGVLCVGESLRVPRHRVDALINHEVGTHLVTWCNGRNQPIRQFQMGLAGYDPLQEGLAVLSEYLVGGLTPARLRVLAGRVLGVHAMLAGAGFVDTYRLLADDHGFTPRTAFIIAVRIHRGGGLTKDAAYLKGLRDLLAYLANDGALDPLFVGKLGLSHTDIVQELVLRGVLRLPVVKPRYISDLAAMERLGACRHMDVMDLLERVGAAGTATRETA